MNVDCLSIERRSASYRTSVNRQFQHWRSRDMSPVSYPPEHVPFDKSDGRVVGAAHARGIFRDHVQHRLNIRRRAGNDAQDFTSRSLLFQRFLELLEQTHILNRDHGLIGEGFKKLNLSLCERTDFLSTDIE